YHALNQEGSLISGRVVATNQSLVLEQLRQQGLRPVEVEETVAENVVARSVRAGRRVARAQIEIFLRQLANLLTAGVPLSRALEIITRETTSASAPQHWSAIRDDVVGGSSLAAALSRWPELFSRVCLAMVRAGETGGFLNLALEQVADFQEREEDLKGRVKAALIYPALLAVLAGAVMIFLLIFFIPRFSAIFAEFGASLPELTRLVIALSQFLVRYGFLIVGVLAVLIVFLRGLLATEKGRRGWENFLLRIPLWGPAIAQLALVRFCRVLGTLLGAGVPLVTALHVAKEAVGYSLLSDGVATAIEEVKSGSSLAKGLAHQEKLFPATVLEMVAVAEESGQLDKELLRLATTYERDLDRKLRALVAVIEPALLFLMAAIVGTVVIGMLLPIFTLQELIR
ncbi:MAG TPA: type II secretion system F family protein, partial [bacterium]|nr:type II secretion system F family protein [bacterium]